MKGLITVLLFAVVVTTSGCSGQTESPERKYARVRYEKTAQTERTSKLSDDQRELDLAIWEQGFHSKYHLGSKDTDATEVESNRLKVKSDNLELAHPSEARADIFGSRVALNQALDGVDMCTSIYRTTIDKKQSDLTTRESGQVRACQVEDLYPPSTK